VTAVSALADDVERLRSLNLQLADWERAGATARNNVSEVLASGFLFRRASGTVVDRDGFLDGLADAGNRNDELVANVVQIQVFDKQAFVEVYVYLDGARAGKPVQGWFRNLRLWERQADNRWLCVFWFNKPLG